MNSIVPPTTDMQGVNTQTNELYELAAFIRDHCSTAFDRHLATMMFETSQQHDLWSGNCSIPHWHDEVPCDDYERSISLGIAWLKAQVLDGGAADGS